MNDVMLRRAEMEVEAAFSEALHYMAQNPGIWPEWTPENSIEWAGTIRPCTWL